jgi:hypothetical protein
MKKLRFILFLTIFIYTSISAKSGMTFTLYIEIPKFNTSEYHAPYLATWIETKDRKPVIATSLWFDEQEKWLKDIRQWWRKTGRNQKTPYDGITGATRRPGMHKLKLSDSEISIALVPGEYFLFIEAAREVGGREVLKIPFIWPIENHFNSSVQGKKELGKITLSIHSQQESL